MYSIVQFIDDAKKILARDDALEAKQAEIGERLSALSRVDNLTRLGLPIGVSDGSTQNYLLWREPPYTALVLGQFDPYYVSPVHEHADFWVVGCGYRGRDRWDMYERFDDGSDPDYADVRLVDQVELPPGKSIWMPRPPRAIHAHNNIDPGVTLELIFTAAKPLDSNQRLIYDVDGKRCWPSPFNIKGVFVGDHYPPRPVQAAKRLTCTLAEIPTRVARRARGIAGCPVCFGIEAALGA